MGWIDEAFEAYPRELFLPEEARGKASLDAPVPIGYGQTNSQPSTVRFMLEQLDVRPGDAVLDVGAGSGWTTALLSYLTGESGVVTAVEVVPELVRFGRDNCVAAGVNNAEFQQATGAFGWPESAPYDRILVSAAADTLPDELTGQLQEGGRMVIPVNNAILVVDNQADGIHTMRHGGFAFVPLIPGDT